MNFVEITAFGEFQEFPLDIGELVVATVVPEPTSSLLLVLGVLGLMGARQKRRRR